MKAAQWFGPYSTTVGLETAQVGLVNFNDLVMGSGNFNDLLMGSSFRVSLRFAGTGTFPK